MKKIQKILSLALAVLVLFGAVPFAGLLKNNIVKASDDFVVRDFGEGELKDYNELDDSTDPELNKKITHQGKMWLSAYSLRYPDGEYRPTKQPFYFLEPYDPVRSSMSGFYLAGVSGLISSNTGSGTEYYFASNVDSVVASITEYVDLYEIYKNNEDGKKYAVRSNDRYTPKYKSYVVTIYRPGALTPSEELAKAKEEAKKEIDKLENLTDEDKNKAKTDIDNASDIPTVNQIVEDAKKKDADNKAASDEKAKEEELAKAKEEAKKEIDKLENLTDEDKNKAKTDIDNASDIPTVNQIVEDAKKKDADNKAASDEKAKEEELAKAKEEAKKEIDKLPGLTNTDKDEYAKEIDSAKTVKEVKDIIDEAKKKSEAKLNENDPEYLKNKLKSLIEEAKRVRYPSEVLEEAIDEAYDILLDRYSRVEDYKYAIENLERILQNMRDTRRNRFKLDVDDLNEKDEELTGKTETKWYIDVYNGKKRILSGQANYKGDFAIEIKKGKIKAKDTLKVVATDPQNDKKYKEVEIEVGGDSKETKDNKPTFNINDLLQADGSKPLTDLAVFPVGKNFYNVVQNGQKTTVYMDVKTFISGNRTMLPIRYIAYTLGFNVEYDNFTREAIFSNTENSALAKKTIRVNIDTGLMKDSYGNVFASDVRPVLINNRIHASIANIARMFEASQGTIEDGINQTIEWDSARKAVYVFKNIK